MTDEEIAFNMRHDTRLNRVRAVFSGEVGRLEQAEQQRKKPTPVERRRMEFEAVRKIAAALGVQL